MVKAIRQIKARCLHYTDYITM